MREIRVKFSPDTQELLSQKCFSECRVGCKVETDLAEGSGSPGVG